MNTKRISRRGVLAASASVIGTAGMVDTTRPTKAEGTGSKTINHLVIFGGSPKAVIEYEFSVSGRLRKSGSGDGAPIATDSSPSTGKTVFRTGGNTPAAR